ncbi:MAG: hypothetical protein ACRENU_05815 [Gemmatimonadaceae bacterium]
MSRILHSALVFAALASSATLGAQPSTARYPNAEKSLTVAPGETVNLLNRIVHEGGPSMRPPGRRLDLQYSTAIPASDSLGRRQQADRAAQFFGPQAIELGVRRLSIGICDTRACAERRDPPGVWYLYERTNNGWKRAP